MIQLIADSGSTKTDWRLLMNDSPSLSFKTVGLNPYSHPVESIKETLRTGIVPNIPDQAIDRIHFYGSGCSAVENKKVMVACLSEFFPKASITIETDLLGAARALLGDKPGFAGILGTGSNTGIYDGREITKSVDSLGWIIGDEGSGVHMGKKIIEKWLRGGLSQETEGRLFAFCRLYRDEIINKVYHHHGANQFLATFAEFVFENRDDPDIGKVVGDSFDSLMKDVISFYALPKDHKLNFVGSIAWHFQSFLTVSAQSHHYQIGRILQSPVDELVKYHVEK